MEMHATVHISTVKTSKNVNAKYETNTRCYIVTSFIKKSFHVI